MLLFPYSERARPSGTESTEHTDAARAASAELSQIRAELESAREEVVFLREQLRSAQRFHAHCLDDERARLRAARQVLVRELSVLVEALQSQGHAPSAPLEPKSAPIAKAEPASEASEIT